MNVIVERSKRGRLRVTGADRVRFLQGLTTINVEKLQDGTHAWGAILNPKGRVLAGVNLARSGDALIVHTEHSISVKIRSLLVLYAV